MVCVGDFVLHTGLVLDDWRGIMSLLLLYLACIFFSPLLAVDGVRDSKYPLLMLNREGYEQQRHQGWIYESHPGETRCGRGRHRLNQRNINLRNEG